MKPTEPVVSGQGTHAQFQETRWSTVLAAIDPSATIFHEALNKLCRTYWYPIYALARRSGVSPHDAADFTQSFFSLLIEKSRLKNVDPSKGKFRSFLLASFKNFLHNEHDKEHAQKRGGGQELLSLDEDTAEGRYQLERGDHTSAERLYDVQWAVTLVNEVVEELRADYTQAGETPLFEALQPYLTGDVPDGCLAEIASRLAINPSTLKSRLHRLRREEFGARLRQQVCHTLANPTEQDVRDELRYLFTVIGR